MSNTTTQKGRKGMVIDWPQQSFTIKQLKEREGDKISTVSIQLKINRAIADGILRQNGNVKSKGRPSLCYERISPAATVIPQN